MLSRRGWLSGLHRSSSGFARHLWSGLNRWSSAAKSKSLAQGEVMVMTLDWGEVMTMTPICYIDEFAFAMVCARYLVCAE